MKIKSVLNLCKKSKNVGVYTDEKTKEQWLCDGHAYYRVSGIPIISGNEVLALMDIPESKKMDYRVYEEELKVDLFEDTYKDELEVFDESINIVYRGCEMHPFITSKGIKYISTKHLAPLKDKPIVDLSFFERGELIAVKDGFILEALIYPFNIVDDNLVHSLEVITNKSRVFLKNKKSKFKEDEQIEM